MKGQGGARPLTEAEKGKSAILLGASAALGKLAGRMPFAQRVLDRRLTAAIRKPGEARPWFAIPSPFAEAALRECLTISIAPEAVSNWLYSEALAAGAVISPRHSFVGGGDWSALIAPLRGHRLDQEIRDLIACRGSVVETASFQILVQRIADAPGPLVHNGVRLASRADALRYLEGHAALIDSIWQHGLLPRAQALGLQNPGAGRPRGLERRESETGIALGAGGELLRYRGGFHRAAIARELKLKSMPVAVRLIHVDWLKAGMAATGLAPLPALLAGLERIRIK